MVVCVNCGGALEDRWKFCIFCGTPVSKAPISDPAPEPAREPDAGPSEDEPGAEPDAEPNAELAAQTGAEPEADQPGAHPGREPDIASPIDDGPDWEPEPARPPIPSAIRTFVPVEIANEDEDDPANRQIRPRFRPRSVDIPLVLGIALGIAGLALIIYMIAVLSGQG
ncbi:MAG: hypothetical protein LH605_06490 [Microbacteriaceae bacterium]|nr:hypothetical protein [Microbacteriaceae bacterium]